MYVLELFICTLQRFLYNVEARVRRREKYGNDDNGGERVRIIVPLVIP